MRTSRLLIPTLREDPGEAEVVSHRLMLRAGLIRKVAAGVYSYLPLGLRIIQKIETIVREEMNRAGAQELLLPIMSPAELWRETGRWDHYGKELFRLQDRHERSFCLGPTHEEVMTDLVRREVRSYRQMGFTCYQIQIKFRDEIRPRFGVMRGREFLMKDAYSFDRDEEAAKRSYQGMYEAYQRIFSRCGLIFRPVEADTGLIGGTTSHEFMVLAETGEEVIVYDEEGAYAANVERAECLPPSDNPSEEPRPLRKVHTPNARTAEDVAAYLGTDVKRIVKTLLYQTDRGDIVAILIPGDREANPIKIKKFLGVQDVILADAERVQAISSAPVGFAGPIGLQDVRIIADHSIQAIRNLVLGANEADHHWVDANWGRDFTIEHFTDLRNARAGDPSPQTGSPLLAARGIEVGHVFMLGTKYSTTMGATFLDPQGQEQPAVMGCYGIGIGRTAAAAIEQNHDDKGIIWPAPIAPFHVHLLPLGHSESVTGTASQLYEQLVTAGIETLWDDRDERAGVKFNDADLLGAPYQLVVGEKGLAKNGVELKERATGSSTMIAREEVVTTIQAKLAAFELPATPACRPPTRRDPS